MSPELHENKIYDEKSDIWSLACILYEMCTNETAFTGDIKELIKIICNNNPPELPRNSNKYNAELKNLLQRSTISRNT